MMASGASGDGHGCCLRSLTALGFHYDHMSPYSEKLSSGSLLIRAVGRGAADGQRPPRQAALGAVAAVARATTSASSAATRSMGSARPAPLATPPATTGARPVSPG